MGVTIRGGVPHHCTECKGPLHGCLCSANGNDPNYDGTELICLLCQQPNKIANKNKSKNKHTDDSCKQSGIKDLSQKFNDAIITGGSNDESDNNNNNNINI
jgi:hypothetical protein